MGARPRSAVHISTMSTKKEEKKQKKKERTAAANLNFPYGCVDKREQLNLPCHGVEVRR